MYDTIEKSAPAVMPTRSGILVNCPSHAAMELVAYDKTSLAW
ncbi:MAG: hypothetical protein ABIP73_05885 [Gemmatimonadaceae bacterium]